MGNKMKNTKSNLFLGSMLVLLNSITAIKLPNPNLYPIAGPNPIEMKPHNMPILGGMGALAPPGANGTGIYRGPDLRPTAPVEPNPEAPPMPNMPMPGANGTGLAPNIKPTMKIEPNSEFDVSKLPKLPEGPTPDGVKEN